MSALASAQRAGSRVEDIGLRQPNLDEVFLALTGAAPPPSTDARPFPPARPVREECIMRATTHAAHRSASRRRRTRHERLTVTRRALLRFLRTPQLIVLAPSRCALFFLIYRYVFGGAIPRRHPYVDYLVPGFITTGVLFTGIGTSVEMAEDLERRFVDRLRSVADPRDFGAWAGGPSPTRACSTWNLAVTIAIAFAVGFRLHGSVPTGLAAFGAGACCSVSRSSGCSSCSGCSPATRQAAQGMAMIVFPFAFVSSAYVPVTSMPGWLQAFAEHQPITTMVDAVRSLTLWSRRPNGCSATPVPIT